MEKSLHGLLSVRPMFNKACINDESTLYDDTISRMVTTTRAAKMAAWEATLGSKALSPMVPFKNNLRFLKYVGLPLKFSNDATEITEKGRLWKCILLPGGELFICRSNRI